MTKRYRRTSKNASAIAYALGSYNFCYAFKSSVFAAKKYQNTWLVTFILLLGVFAASAWYVSAISARVGEDYKIDELESSIQTLNEEHQNLVVRLSQEKTLDKIEQRAISLGLVPAEKSSYLAIPGSFFAQVGDPGKIQ